MSPSGHPPTQELANRVSQSEALQVAFRESYPEGEVLQVAIGKPFSDREVLQVAIGKSAGRKCETCRVF